MPMHFFFFFFCPSLHVTSTPPRLPRPVRVSTSSELYPDTRFIYSLFFLNAQTPVFLICSLVTYGTPHHARGHPHSYLGKQRISLGVAIILRMCLCPHTQLDCNQFAITPRFVFIHNKTAKILLVVKTLIKTIEQQPH